MIKAAWHAEHEFHSGGFAGNVKTWEHLHSAGRLTLGEISLTSVTTGRLDGKSHKEKDMEEGEARFVCFPTEI